ncbi:hypothetical protein EIP86_001629, partial [Pleurotus ostreatoroseus]
MSQYTDFNFIMETKLLNTYMSWVDRSMADKYNDAEWMETFADCIPDGASDNDKMVTDECDAGEDGESVDAEAEDANINDIDDIDAVTESHTAPASKKKPSGAASKKAGTPTKSTRSPPKRSNTNKLQDDKKKESAVNSSSSAVVKAKRLNPNELRDACRKWLNNVLDTEAKGSSVPGFSMHGLPSVYQLDLSIDAIFTYVVSSAAKIGYFPTNTNNPELATTEWETDVLFNTNFKKMSRKAK